jgi:hypothetical protein
MHEYPAMNMRIAAIRHRRALLIARCALQRIQVAQVIQPWRKPLAMADTLAEVVRAVRQHPVFAAAGTSLFITTTRHRWLLWAARLFTLWEVVQVVRAQWPKAPGQKHS